MEDRHIEVIWKSLITHAQALSETQFAFDMRRRLNPHHPTEDQIQESRKHIEYQQIEWKFIKETYVQHREQLLERKGSDPHRISFCENMEKVLADDFERIVFGGR